MLVTDFHPRRANTHEETALRSNPPTPSSDHEIMDPYPVAQASVFWGFWVGGLIARTAERQRTDMTRSHVEVHE